MNTNRKVDLNMQIIAGIIFSVLAAMFISASALTVIVLMSLPSDTWQNWRPATCLGTGCFCESVNTQSPIRQTANTVSSLSFIFSGLLIPAFSFNQSNLGRLPRGYSLILGISSVIIGVGSAFYHASLTLIGQFFDVFGMFLLASFALVYAWERIYKLQRRTTLMLYLLLNVGLSWLQIAVPETHRYAFAVVLLAALFFELFFQLKAKPQIAARWLGIATGLMAGAYIIWILDNTHTVCFENSILQGHAVWHVLGATAVMFLHRYYGSEVN